MRAFAVRILAVVLFSMGLRLGALQGVGCIAI